ncbi:hypothetical protein GVN99_13725 [Serratia marcescens]|nr:DUF6631 family protein [Serratia marcescens]NSM20177.1 hypothetical protein [Serratia marcescens]NSM49080.1 hypothetical protein [Serratia marcescens]CVC81489.1 Uncharacterised protein [Serratia marcescens]
MSRESQQAAAPQDDDLSVLLSTRDITIAGQHLTVREFTLVDSLTMHEVLKPVVASLADVMQSEWPSFEAVQDVLAEHADALPKLIACSADQPVEWVATLPGSDGTALMDLWWTVNRRFFMSAAVRQITLRAAREKLSLSAASSPRSSGQATTQTGSDTTPPGS